MQDLKEILKKEIFDYLDPISLFTLHAEYAQAVVDYKMKLEKFVVKVMSFVNSQFND